MAGARIPLNDLGRHCGALADVLAPTVRRVMERGWYVLGPENADFEARFASYCGTEHAIGVANGTDAIELALRAAGVAPGDRVATVANAGFYTTAALTAICAAPLFVDVDADTQLVAGEALSSALDNPVRAVVVTHLYGRLADVETIVDLCAERSIPVIEDCAQAHGANRGGRRAGSFGLAGCFSFYPTKNLGAIGDGGAIVTNDDAFAASVRSLRQYGWSGKYHVCQPGGRNSRLDEVQAAVLAAKLSFLDGWNARRRDIAQRYTASICDPRITCPKVTGEDYVAHLYVIRTDDRDDLRRHLEKCGIASEIHYPVPDHRQPCMTDEAMAELPVTERCANEVLTLPCFPEMSDAEVERVIDAVNSW